ncbi:hypothetical protein A3860_10995 [Niastella vici]|uniref:DUF3857 domain-containing protein n=1 Tax=Niastella vici TaxID=1703345 RepID=A0A1V9FFE8_9BACT|nr:DUF3857 domain-containing protein [Niastella vici]OQP57085.1 hypothetical protein A3860_10995 [Niastella vici]
MLHWNKQVIAACFLVCSVPVLAQTAPAIEQEQWNGQPTIQTPDARYSSESAVILFEKRRIEYIDEKTDLASYKTFHTRIHINDDKGIESFNKIYLPVNNNADIVDIRARTILPGGKVIDLDKKNIKDMQEDDQLYKIFAMEGLVKDCEIEYYYTYKANVSFFGRDVIQRHFPVLDEKVEVVSPARLIFEAKGYNEVNAPVDTVLGTKRFITVHQQNIPGAVDEKYATLTANLKRVEYKLSYNKSNQTDSRLFTWNELAKRAYSIYATYTDKELKKVDGLISSNGWKNTGNEAAVVIAVEHYLKTNISTREDIADDNAENLEWIIKNKIASYRGIVRLYGAIFKELAVNYEFVMCGSRDDFSVDRSFENWNNCDNQLIYFAKLNKYIAPTLLQMRYPLIDPSWVGTNGIHCKGTVIGNFATAVAFIRPVAGEDYTRSGNNIEAKIRLNKTLDTLVVNSRQLYSGYSAVYYRTSFNFTSEEKQRLLLKELVKFGTSSEQVVSSKIENKEMESYQDNKPFILDMVVNASELVEKAGNKILVKIGEIIGPQVEMYQEKPRQYGMDVNYPHVLDRTIEFTIPDGYKVKNADDLKMSKVYKDNDELAMGFESTYTQEGNVIKVHVVEQYRKIQYPLAWYEDFKKIINAAADFNKVTLVLEAK